MTTKYQTQLQKRELEARIQAGEISKPSLNRKNLSAQIAKMDDQGRALIRCGLYEFTDNTRPSDLNQSELWTMGNQP